MRGIECGASDGAPVCDDLGRGTLCIRGCQGLGCEHERAHDGSAIIAQPIRQPALVNEAAEFDQTTRASAPTAASTSTCAPGSTSTDPKWRLVTGVLGQGPVRDFLSDAQIKRTTDTDRDTANEAARTASPGNRRACRCKIVQAW